MSNLVPLLAIVLVVAVLFLLSTNYKIHIPFIDRFRVKYHRSRSRYHYKQFVKYLDEYTRVLDIRHHQYYYLIHLDKYYDLGGQGNPLLDLERA